MNLNQKIAAQFHEIADLLELENANVFRIRAYRTGASILQNLPKSVAKISRADLPKISGIGVDLADKIVEFRETGKIKFLEKKKRGFPRGFLEILRIPGLGPKTARRLHTELNIRNVRELERAAKRGELETLEGIRAKTVANILDGISLIRGNKTERRPFGEAQKIARKIVGQIRRAKVIEKIEVAGSLRRKRPTIGDIDLLATAKNSQKAFELFTGLADVQKILGRGPTKSSVLLKNGMQVDLRIVPTKSLGAALLYFTGNKNHNIHLRKVAIKHGWKLNEYGLFEQSKNLASQTEKAIYQKLGEKYLPPEKREL